MLEREKELSELEALIQQVRSGAGALLMIEGEPGIGKTELLLAARERAQGAGLTVLAARGTELETDFPFGVVRQLFEPHLARCEPHERVRLLAGAAALSERVIGGGAQGAAPDGGDGDVSFSVLHGLYWLTANLCALGPVLLWVDDLQWADQSSLRWLGFLAHRLEDLPLLVAGAIRSDRSEPDAHLESLVEDSRTRVLRPAPLSEAAVSELVGGALGSDAAGEFCRACHAATGGNPFLAIQLLDELGSEGVAPSAANAARVQALGPASVSRATLVRLGRLPPAAASLARSVAIVGSRVALGVCAALAGLDEDTAGNAADLLAGAHILARRRPPEFIHSIVRTAVYRDTPAFERAAAHMRAARLLDEAGAELDAVATHLLAGEPTGDPWVVDRLRAAADHAAQRGAPDAAVRYLRRALEEPPDPAERPELLLRLGGAEVLSGDAEAPDRLRQAIATGSSPVLRARAAWLLAGLLTLAAEGERAAALLGEAIDALPDDQREIGIRLEAELWVAGYTSGEARRFVTARAPRFRPDRERLGTAGDRAMLGIEALEIALTRGPAREAVEVAQRAVGDGVLLAAETADTNTFYAASGALYYADAFAPSIQVFSSAIDEALRRGSVRGAAMAAGWRAMTHQRRGGLVEAEADARQLLDNWERVGPIGLLVGTAPVLESQLERGELAAADELLAGSGLAGPMPDTILSALVLHPRARLHLAQQRLDQALADLDACATLEERWGVQTPALTTWRATAAMVHAARGDPATARELAEDELQRARAFGAPRALGIALRAAGLAATGPRSVELLRKAVGVLEPSGAELEHARALIDLGAQLRRGGQRSEAREPLRAGLATARRCGALALAARAHQELEATGVHQRKILATGIEALTPSERRVAQMAADGLRNRDIAQALFVTVKTVEGHLTNAYLKLDLHSRDDLARALATESQEPMPPATSPTRRHG